MFKRGGFLAPNFYFNPNDRFGIISSKRRQRRRISVTAGEESEASGTCEMASIAFKLIKEMTEKDADKGKLNLFADIADGKT